MEVNEGMKLKPSTSFELGKGFINLSLAFFISSIIQPIVKDEVSLKSILFGILGFFISGVFGILLLEAGGTEDADRF